MMLFFVLPVIWYVVCEAVLSYLRKPRSMPTPLSFWMGIAQSAGSALLAVIAVSLVFFGKN